MAEGTYEYECARAELLGIAAPNRDEFEAAARERQQQDNEHETLLVRYENVFVSYCYSSRLIISVCVQFFGCVKQLYRISKCRRNK